MRVKGRLFTRVDMGTDEMDINYIDDGDWEDFIKKDPEIYKFQES